MRPNCDLAVYINVPKALAGKQKSRRIFILLVCHLGLPFICSFLLDGIEFYQSENKVLLTPGDAEGVLGPQYFLRAQRLKPSCEFPKQLIHLDRCK